MDKKFRDIIGRAVVILSMGIGALIGIALRRYLGLYLLFFLIPILLGIWFPGWYLKKRESSSKFIKTIAWSNVLSWILPPLGIFTSITTFGFSQEAGKESKKYKILAGIGLFLAICNAVLGYLGIFNS